MYVVLQPRDTACFEGSIKPSWTLPEEQQCQIQDDLWKINISSISRRSGSFCLSKASLGLEEKSDVTLQPYLGS